MKHILIANRWRTPDGTLLESKHVHDYVSHVDQNGDLYFIDGGTEYIRMSKNTVPMTSECLYADDDFEQVRKVVTRGALKEDGTRVWVPLYKMTDSHVLNCIGYNLRRKNDAVLYDVHTHLYIAEMLYRIRKDIYIPDIEYTKKYLESEPVYEQMLCRTNECDDITINTPVRQIREVVEACALSRDTVHTTRTYYVLALLNSMFNDAAEKYLKDETEVQNA